MPISQFGTGGKDGGYKMNITWHRNVALKKSNHQYKEEDVYFHTVLKIHFRPGTQVSIANVT